MPIDNKDEPGQYRREVFEDVQAQLGFKGAPPTRAEAFLGDWLYRFHWRHDTRNTTPTARQSFQKDGYAPAKALDGSFENPKDRWVLNEDMSLSIWSHVDAMPDYGIPEPTYSEDRYHVLLNGPDTFVLFNGDGSIIMIYEREPD